MGVDAGVADTGVGDTLGDGTTVGTLDSVAGASLDRATVAADELHAATRQAAMSRHLTRVERTTERKGFVSR